MSLRSPIYKELLKEYDEIRTQSQKELKLKKQYVYKLIPRVEEIDKELSLTGIKVTKAIINNPTNSQTLVLNLEEENQKLIKERNILLVQHGFSQDYLDLQYLCPYCKDTGYIGSKICKCMQQKLINKAYSESNLKDILIYENFKNFDLSFYSSDIEDGESISAKENIYSVIKICHNFVEKFDYEFSNIIFYGKSGRGKTFLCHCIAKEMLDRGKIVLYTTAFELFKMVEKERFTNNKDEETDEYLSTIFNVDLLIIDDLGTEVSTIVTSSEFYNIINLRLINKKPTIISTNLAPSNWITMYSDRVVSRIHGNYTLLKVIGTDIRLEKKYYRNAN